ncbi:MAG: hypothetical protein ACE5OR_13435, partial [bacterium]
MSLHADDEGSRGDGDLVWDDGDPHDHLWSSAANWDPDRVPSRSDNAIIDLAGSTCEITSSLSSECDRCVVGFTAGPCSLNVTGGTLDCAG